MLFAVLTDDSLSNYAVSLVMLVVTGLAGFFVRQAFADIKESLTSLNSKLDKLNGEIQTAIKDNAVMDQRVKSLEAAVLRLENQVREMSEGVLR